MERNQFFNFDQQTVRGNNQRILYLNTFEGDYFPLQEWTDTQFTNVAADQLAYIRPPPNGWAVIDDCGLWPCTGPKNVLMDFKDSTFQGTSPSYASSSFQLISENSDFSQHPSNCTQYSNMNAYICDNNDLGVLMFESLDADKFDRAVAPVYIGQTGTSINNTVNSFMDHVWDGFYTGQVRLSAFPSLILAP